MKKKNYSERFCLSRTAGVKSAPVEQFAFLIWMYCLAERQRKVPWSPHPKRSGDACMLDMRSPGFVIAVSLAPKVTVDFVALSHRSMR